MKSKKREPIKFGIIGFGGAGLAQISHFHRDPDTVVTAILDTKQPGLERARTKYPQVFSTDNFEEFMGSGIDAVAICSPDRTHADYVVAALDAGKHVFCEKPLADTIEGCKAILDAQKRNPNVIASVNHQMRFLPVHIEMKRLIESGELGRIGYVEGYYVHSQVERGAKYDTWRYDDRVTPLIFSGCHFVDVIRWLLDDEVEEITGMANNICYPGFPESDLNVLVMRFKSGVVAKVVVAFGAGRPQEHSVRVYGSEKSIENNLLFSPGGSYEIFARPHLPKDDPGYRRPRFPRSIDPRRHFNWLRDRSRPYRTYWWARAAEMIMRRQGEDEEYSVMGYPIRLYPHKLAVRNSIREFVSAVRGESKLTCPLEEGAKTVATCVAGVEAYRTGKTVKQKDFWLPEFDGISAQPQQAAKTQKKKQVQTV